MLEDRWELRSALWKVYLEQHKILIFSDCTANCCCVSARVWSQKKTEIVTSMEIIYHSQPKMTPNELNWFLTAHVDGQSPSIPHLLCKTAEKCSKLSSYIRSENALCHLKRNLSLSVDLAFDILCWESSREPDFCFLFSCRWCFSS